MRDRTGYRVDDVTGGAAGNREAAEFLANFVRDGGLPCPRSGDEEADVWQRRFFWWWDENPFCRDDSPRGFLLRDDAGELVGFNGLIPFDYAVDGEVVPTLVTTSFFVEEEHRSAVMGMLTRQRRLGARYQVIDGSPSPEMRRLLDKLGYRHSGERYQYFFPLRKFGGGATRAMLRPFGLSVELPDRREEECRWRPVTWPEGLGSIPELRDGKLRRRITPESLAWLCEVGSEERSFFSLVDADDAPVAYAIGMSKERWGLKACLLMDYVDFRPEIDGLGRLIRRIVEEPTAFGLAGDTDLIAWSVFADSRPGRNGLKRDSILHYQLPGRWEGCEKACLPFEGDLPLL